MLETIAAAYSGFIGSISNYLYTYILIVLLVAGGIYFTVRTKFVQFRFLPESIRIVMQPSEDQNSISAFKTLMVSTASRVAPATSPASPPPSAWAAPARCSGCGSPPCWAVPPPLWKALWLRFIRSVPRTAAATAAPLLHRAGSQAALAGRSLCRGDDPHYMVGFNLVASFNIADSLKAYSFYDPTLTPWIVGIVLAVVFLVCISGGGKQIAKITSSWSRPWASCI